MSLKDVFNANKSQSQIDNLKCSIKDISGEVENPKMLKEACKIALSQFETASNLGSVQFSDEQILHSLKKLKNNKSVF
jgi:hypothetical protein